MGNPLCVLSQNGMFLPFRIWAACFPFRHHRSTMAPSIHWTVLLAQVERNHERLHHHLTPPLVQPEGCGHHIIADPLSRIGSPRHWTSSSKQGTRMGAVCDSQCRVVPPYTALFIPTFWLGLGLDSDALGFDHAHSLRRKPLSRFPSRLERWIRTRKLIIKYIYLVRYTKPNLAFYIPTPVFVPSSHLASSLCLLAGYVG